MKIGNLSHYRNLCIAAFQLNGSLMTIKLLPSFVHCVFLSVTTHASRFLLVSLKTKMKLCAGTSTVKCVYTKWCSRAEKNAQCAESPIQVSFCCSCFALLFVDMWEVSSFCLPCFFCPSVGASVCAFSYSFPSISRLSFFCYFSLLRCAAVPLLFRSVQMESPRWLLQLRSEGLSLV